MDKRYQPGAPSFHGSRDRTHVGKYIQLDHEGAPFGGYKTSGIGRETHKVILEHYTQMKNIMINLGEVPTGFYPAK